jgi:hypothetical protein
MSCLAFDACVGLAYEALLLRPDPDCIGLVSPVNFSFTDNSWFSAFGELGVYVEADLFDRFSLSPIDFAIVCLILRSMLWFDLWCTSRAHVAMFTYVTHNIHRSLSITSP